MRVLHVIPAVATRYGGPSTAIVPMCRALAASGIDATIAATDADGPARLRVPISEPTSWGGVPAIFCRKTFSEAYKYSPSLASWLGQHVRDFEIVHIHGLLSHACLAAGAACQRQGVPYVVRPLGTLVPWSLQQKPFKKRLLLACGGMRALRGAAAIHYTSQQERRSVETSLELSGGVVVPLGIDPALLETPVLDSRERDQDRYVLAMSRLHPKKNLDALIEAFIDISETRRDSWRLVIAGTGDGTYAASLRKLVDDRRAQGRVQFVGWIDGEPKLQLVRRASVFALCSKHENFGLSVLEALAAGVPTLLSRQVDLADDVDSANAGWIVDDVHDSLRRALAAAVGDDQARAARGGAARSLAWRFTWPMVAVQLSDLYARLCRRGSEPAAGLLPLN